MDVHHNARLAPRGREAMVRAVVDEGIHLATLIRKAKSLAADLDRFRAFAARLDGCPLAGEARHSALEAGFEVEEQHPPQALTGLANIHLMHHVMARYGWRPS